MAKKRTYNRKKTAKRATKKQATRLDIAIVGLFILSILSAVLIYAIYKQNYEKNISNKPIKLCIPVNLKKYFQSKTMSNFFSYITLEAEIKKDKLDTFEKILELKKKKLYQKEE